MIKLIFAVICIVIVFYCGAWYTESKYKRILWKTIVSLKKEKRESDAAWEKYCRELRRHYEKALTERHSNEESEGKE
jgi:hypothetical protein